MAMESSVSKAVRQGLLATTLGSIALVGTNVAVAEEANDDVERIAVTGSRIKQVDIETSSPVTVITAADIQLSGEATVADVLNNSSVNSFGSWRGMSGYGSGGAASSNVNMRGLGSNYTLVLLDGRRMPGTSSSSGAAADTSRIPMAIVDRIEILRDGASAVYGSDAVAGVINIITKKDYEGLNFTYDTEQPDVDGGELDRFTVTTGYTSDKGNITLTYEYYDSKAVYDRDIWKLNDPTYGDYSSFSSVPNGYYNTGEQNEDGKDIYAFYSNSDLCSQTDNVLDGTDGANDGRCFYSYGAVTKLFGDKTQNSILSNFNYELTDDIQFRGRASAAQSKTDSRYAGTPVSTNYPVMSADNQYNPVGEDMTLYMRSVQIGERDTRTEVNTIDFLGGFLGYVDIGNGLDWEINAQHSVSTTNAFNYNLINDDIIQNLVDSGDYDIFNTSGMEYAAWDAMMADFYGQAAHTGLYQAEFTSTQIDGLVSTTLFDNGSFSLAGVVGAEYEMIEFIQKSDPQSASGKVSGGSGGDDVDADRDRTSVYMELQAALPFNLDINAALRYDEYDQSGDVGSRSASGKFDKVNPMVGLAWRPWEPLLLRASWGQSFRAPNMGEMFSTQALSFEDALDTKWCDANPGVDDNYCRPQQQHKTWIGGNPDLQPEEGESLTAGFVWNITDALAVEASYYDITLDNRIASQSVSRILKDEIDNGGSDLVVRDADGKIDVIYSFDQNMASLETSGFDFKASYALETGFGDFGLSGEMSYVNEFVSTTEPGAAGFDYAGLQGYPELKGNVNLNWAYNGFGAAWATYYTGPQDSGNEEYGVDYYADIPSYVKHNVQVSYAHNWNGKVTLGLNNVFDKEAPSQYDGFVGWRDVDTALYDVLGRTVFFKIEQSF
ncbi:TonB-dependent receptor [Ferrimonas balearica]|uniref:TonB-dependent receptor n=1 Tax=Ferrimonas balearica TaxID=44012 RepID=UPI001F2C0590|nr:TonB-dependent receptor [Ferrimonas balearica]MBY6018378.1 TonB-dependent receptor [Halomonas denitrificans]MBY6094730.1 TonB-dependent receptor [Ferrimonas balearica]